MSDCHACVRTLTLNPLTPLIYPILVRLLLSPGKVRRALGRMRENAEWYKANESFAALVEIQRVWRGAATRCFLKGTRAPMLTHSLTHLLNSLFPIPLTYLLLNALSQLSFVDCRLSLVFCQRLVDNGRP